MATASLIDPAIDLLNLDLPAEDGEPLESAWHRAEINLLIDSLYNHWRGRSDFYAGGNMFIYYSLEQVRRGNFLGPDFFVVLGVDGAPLRESWVVWNEGGRYPDLIVELASPTTALADRTTKKDLYEQIFRMPEYFLYDPATQELTGWRRSNGKYGRPSPKTQGRLWSKKLGLWLGLWHGVYLGQDTTWLRFYTEEGDLVLTGTEAEARQAAVEARRADAEAKRADSEAKRAAVEAQRAEEQAQRAEQAEAEIERLRAQLRAAGIDPNAPPGR